MQNIEPHFRWRHLYQSNQDPNSPYFQHQNSEVFYTDVIYNYVIHPQWDSIDSETLFTKILFADYEEGYAIFEFIGEWNDCLQNDIMLLKRQIVEPLMRAGITKFIFLMDNVLNFHASDDCYYEEWFEELEEGWVAMVNLRPHVYEEICDYQIDQYLLMGGNLNDYEWQKRTPQQVYTQIEALVVKRIA